MRVFSSELHLEVDGLIALLVVAELVVVAGQHSVQDDAHQSAAGEALEAHGQAAMRRAGILSSEEERRKDGGTAEQMEQRAGVAGRIGELEAGSRNNHAQQEAERHFPADDAAEDDEQAAEEEKACMDSAKAAELEAREKAEKNSIAED